MFSRFRLILAVSLGFLLLVKSFSYGTVSNPTPQEILTHVEPYWSSRGFTIVEGLHIGGREAMLAGRDACQIYIVPVAPQGWHQAALRQSLDESQSLWYVFEGKITRDEQLRWRPMLNYYASKALRNVGFDVNYSPVIALVTNGECEIENLDVANIPSVPFDTRTLADVLL